MNKKRIKIVNKLKNLETKRLEIVVKDLFADKNKESNISFEIGLTMLMVKLSEQAFFTFCNKLQRKDKKI